MESLSRNTSLSWIRQKDSVYYWGGARHEASSCISRVKSGRMVEAIQTEDFQECSTSGNVQNWWAIKQAQPNKLQNKDIKRQSEI